MADIQIVPAKMKHVNRIANRMRDADRLECEALGRTAKQALREGVAQSDWAWTFLVDGQPEGMAGITITSELTGDAVPWFLSTDEAFRHGRAFLEIGPPMIASFSDSRRTLANVVAACNHRAIRMLKRWGFTIQTEQAFVLRGVEMIPFILEP